MRVIGLTGGMGSGKSTVAALLARAGAVIVDADQAAREVVEPGQPALAHIVDRFGDEVLAADGSLDRPALARVVFGDSGSLTDLEAITHPRIAERIAEQFEAVADAEAADGRERTVVLDHPLLVETGQAQGYEIVLVVVAPVDVRVRRLAEGRGIDEEDARARIARQTSDETRRAAATHVLDNAGDLDALEEQVERLLDELGLTARPENDPTTAQSGGGGRPAARQRRARTPVSLRLLGVLAAALLLLALVVAVTRARNPVEFESAPGRAAGSAHALEPSIHLERRPA